MKEEAVSEKETILANTIDLFQQKGIEAWTEEKLISQLQLTPETFRELFTDKEDLVRQAIKFDIERQKNYQAGLLKNASGAIDEILILIQEGVKNMQETNPVYVNDLIQYHPEAWNLCLEHLNTYSYHQLYDILNRGVRAGEFRKDINLQLVTKIMLEMVGLLLNQQVFPPERFNLSEVYRSIYLYYIRGICTESGARNADTFFAKNNI